MNTALITGVTGQDGAYLSKLLLSKGYKVYGVARRASTDNRVRLRELQILNDPNLEVIEGDVTDQSGMLSIVSDTKPDEVYNLAAQSHVHTSFQQADYTLSVNANGCLHMLEAIRRVCPQARFYQASTSEMFGASGTDMTKFVTTLNGAAFPGTYSQSELTKFHPVSPYAVAKLAAHQMVDTYRRSYGIHGSCGILFNHESELRGENFVTRKITKWIARVYRMWLNGDFCEYTNCSLFANNNKWAVYTGGIPTGIAEGDKLVLGNLDAHRDWGHAEDYVRAMWLMLQQKNPDDYVIATGQTRTVMDFVTASFMAIGLDRGGPEETAEYAKRFITTDEKFKRPSEVSYLLGDPMRAYQTLGWKPQITFEQMVQRMVDHDIEQELKECGIKLFATPARK